MLIQLKIAFLFFIFYRKFFPKTFTLPEMFYQKTGRRADFYMSNAKFRFFLMV